MHKCKNAKGKKYTKTNLSVLGILSLLNSYRHYTKANEGKGKHQLTFPVLYAMCFPEIFKKDCFARKLKVHDYDSPSIFEMNDPEKKIEQFVLTNEKEIENLLSSNDGSMEKPIKNVDADMDRQKIINLVIEKQPLIGKLLVPVINSLYEKNNVYTAMIVLLDGLKSEVEQLKNNEGDLGMALRSNFQDTNCNNASENILLDIFKCNMKVEQTPDWDEDEDDITK